MQLTVMWLVTAAALLLPIGMWRQKVLRLPRDFFCFLIYAQAFIHLHLAPTLFVQAEDLSGWGGQPDADLQWIYCLMQALCLLCFEWPLLHFYRSGMGRIGERTLSQTLDMSLHAGRVLALCVFAGLFAALFLGVSISNDLLRLPHDTQTIVDLFVELPTLEYGVHRLFIYGGLSVACTLLVVFLRTKTTRLRIAVAVALWTTAGAWMTYAMLNHRLLVTLGAAALAGVWVTVRSSPARPTQKRKRKRSGMLRMATAGTAVLYVLIVANNIRFASFADDDLRWDHFNPFMGFLEYVPHNADPIVDPRWRLNGIDLMARITPAALRDGYALGEGWEDAAAASLGQWFSRAGVRERKLSWTSDPKVYLLWRYTDIRYIDWPNSFLNDLYGNLAFPGLFLGALILARVLVRGTVALTRPDSSVALLLGIYLLTQSLDFEQSFAVWLFGLLRAAPVLVILAVLNPFLPSVSAAPGRALEKLEAAHEGLLLRKSF